MDKRSRQFTVYSFILANPGLSVNEIARTLHISKESVYSCLKRLMNANNVKNNAFVYRKSIERKFRSPQYIYFSRKWDE